MLTLPEFRNQNCTRFRFRYSECRACADACPHDAIALSGEGIIISEKACQNCGLCLAACPTEALTGRNLPRIDILKRTMKSRAVTFACAPSQSPGDETVPCLGALDAAVLATLASAGVAVTLAGTHHCADCPHGAVAPRMIARNLEGVGALAHAAGNPKWSAITVAEHDAADAQAPRHDASRRHLFRRFLGAPASGVAQAASGVEARPVPLKAVRFAPAISTVGRELLQRLFDAAPPADTTPPPPALPLVEGLHVARVEIAAGCTACEVCARACPTGAMQIAESGVGWALTFQLSRCVGCGVCVESCQPRVLAFAAATGNLPAAREIVTLHALNKQRCARCDRFFISSEPAEICTICRGDDDDFTAIFG